jgi:hypothetical protein
MRRKIFWRSALAGRHEREGSLGRALVFRGAPPNWDSIAAADAAAAKQLDGLEVLAERVETPWAACRHWAHRHRNRGKIGSLAAPN